MSATPHEDTGASGGQRIQGVDFFRVIAILAVISIHTSPFSSEQPDQADFSRFLYLAINYITRFAVPFFFVISGYFWGLKCRKSGQPLREARQMVGRIGGILLAWSLIYLFPFYALLNPWHGITGLFTAASWNIEHLLQDPMTLLMQGTKVHLWFLVSLLFSVSIAAVFVQWQWLKSLLVVAILLYGFGMLAKAYAITPLGIQLDFNTRNGPFLGLLFFVSGYFLSGRKRDLQWLRLGLVSFCGGLVLQSCENYFLWKYYGGSPVQDYGMGTCFMGIGVALMALSGHRFFCNRAICAIGRLTLGIYAVHFVFVDLFRGMDRVISNPLWEVALVFMVFALSVGSALLLSKNCLSKKIVI